MSETLFKEVRYILGGLINGIAMGQIANYALVEWDDNLGISDAPPSRYWPKYAERFDKATLAQMMRWHALPAQWWTMAYEESLAARRPLIADVIRQGYQKLIAAAP